jgi:hypothetical protein
MFDSVTVSIIADFLGYVDYPAFRMAIHMYNVDRKILNPSYMSIPVHRMKEYAASRQFTRSNIWGFVAMIISRRICIGDRKISPINLIGHDSADLSRIISGTIGAQVNENKKEWFIANCNQPDIYNLITEHDILRLAPLQIVSKYRTSPAELQKIYPRESLDAIVGAVITNFPVPSRTVLVSLPNQYGIEKKDPITFNALVNAVLSRRYTKIIGGRYHNIEAAIIHHLHVMSGCTLSDGTLSFTRKDYAVAIYDLLTTISPQSGMDAYHEYAAMLGIYRAGVTINDEKMKYRYAMNASPSEMMLIKAIIFSVIDDRFKAMFIRQ